MIFYLPQIYSAASHLQYSTSDYYFMANLYKPVYVESQLCSKYNTNVGLDFIQTIFDKEKLLGIKANKPYDNYKINNIHNSADNQNNNSIGNLAVTNSKEE